MKILNNLLLIFFLSLHPILSEARDSVKIAYIYAKTGRAALGVQMATRGIRFAVQEINGQGGILGREIELLEFDNKSSSLGAKSAARKALQKGVTAVLGSNWSSYSLAMAPVFQEAKIPMITPYSTNPEITLVGDYIFRICYNDSFQGRVVANFAFKDLEVRTSAVLINASSKYSEGLSVYFVTHFEKLGGKVLLKENYLQKTADFSIFLEKIKAIDPDIIFLPGHPKESAFIIKQARAIGISTIFIGGDGWNEAMYKIVGNVIEGNYYSNHWHRNSTLKKSRLFVDKFTQNDKKFEAGTALAYDSVYLLADAIQRGKSFNPSDIRDSIAATESFEGVTGAITFDQNGDPVKSAVILKFGTTSPVYIKTVEP